MKAITIWQPWASLIACGIKKFETRSWSINYRGPIAIHAAKKLFDFKGYSTEEIKKFTEDMHEAGLSYGLNELPLGCIVATAEIVGCLATQKTPWTKIKGFETSFGNWTPGRYAWELANVQCLSNPVPVRGQQGLWDCGYDIDAEIAKQLGRKKA